MKKLLSAIGKKNIIIISGVLLIAVAIYLNLTLNVPKADEVGDGYFLETPTSPEENDPEVFGQITLVDNPNVDQNVSVAEENYFAVSAVNRQRARDEELEQLNLVIESAEGMPDVQTKALNDISAIAQSIEREANIETIIKAKGFDDCVAVVNGENAQIIVKTTGLMDNEVAQIKEIVFEQAQISPVNVKIIEKS